MNPATSIPRWLRLIFPVSIWAKGRPFIFIDLLLHCSHIVVESTIKHEDYVYLGRLI